MHSGTARERAPSTIRALWGTDGTANGIHASVDMDSADKDAASCEIAIENEPHVSQNKGELQSLKGP